MIPIWCDLSSARAAWVMYSTTLSGGSLPAVSTSCLRSIPFRSSITRNGAFWRSGATSASITLTTCSLLIRAEARASRLKRSMEWGSSAAAPCSSLSAT